MTLQQIAGFFVDAADWRACVFLAIAAVVFAALNVWQWRERRRLRDQWRVLSAEALSSLSGRMNELDGRLKRVTQCGTCPQCGLVFTIAEAQNP